MENDRHEKEKQRGKEQFLGSGDHFIFPSHSRASLTVARHFLLHCVECWVYIQEVGSLYPFSFLLVSTMVKHGKCVDTGSEGQRVTRKKLLVKTFGHKNTHNSRVYSCTLNRKGRCCQHKGRRFDLKDAQME